MKDITFGHEFTYEKASERVKNPARSSTAIKASRWGPLDIARGVAISLMILSHCVKSLLSQSMIPEWGMIPVHLVTKFSSSLFIIVFGMSISLYFTSHIGKETWKSKRRWMLKRGIELMVWYKILTVVQMFQFYPKSMIIDTLLFRSMPDFVEILCFYSIALFWLPFFLPLWSRMSYYAKILIILGTFSLGQWLHYHFDFWGLEPLKAILVENEGFYTFGQLQRGALIFLGLIIGDLFSFTKERRGRQNYLPLSCVAIGASSLSYFYFSNSHAIIEGLGKISRNIGKHPFDVNFLSFSLGGALLILGLCLLMNENTQKIFKPISYLGRHSLNAFILHIILLFYFYRYSFGFHRNVTYLQSLALTLCCLFGILVLLYTWNKAKALVK